MLCGIPQGSILGPIIFPVYINDSANIYNKVRLILFADDTNVLYTGKSLEHVFNVLIEE